MSAVFETPTDLSEYLFRIVDNGGLSADRYTVLFTDGSSLDLSRSPSHPQGVSMSGDGIEPSTLAEWVENGEAVDMALGDLPENIVSHILFRNNQGIADFLERVERKDPSAVAPNRDKAEVNEGIHDSLGKGIYDSPEGLRIRLDGDPDDDRGPYATAREAILASIPDKHAFSGEEYHSTVDDIVRMVPSQEVKDPIAELEARREAGDTPSRGM
jgi:hypothetical protein